MLRLLPCVLGILTLLPSTTTAATGAGGCPDAATRDRLIPELEAAWNRPERFVERSNSVDFLELPDAPDHCLAIVNLGVDLWHGAGAVHHFVELEANGPEWKRVDVQADVLTEPYHDMHPSPGVVEFLNGHRVIQFRATSMSHGIWHEVILLVAHIDGSYREVFTRDISVETDARAPTSGAEQIDAQLRFVDGPADLPDIELRVHCTLYDFDPQDVLAEPTRRIIDASRTYRLTDGTYGAIDCDGCEVPDC